MLLIMFIGLVIFIYGSYRFLFPLTYGAGGLIDYKDIALMLSGVLLFGLGVLL